ncbi:MAG: glycoside hydrolase family 92 protein, partial [Prevotella sp.]|nr:glycoside hydrolase family 92 protein [Prevotella sp.]
MKRFFLTTIALLTGIAAFSEGDDFTKFVNPRIGTGGHGHVFLGANVPFGYVQLGPTQPTRGWDWCSGYHHSDSVLIGFGHQHLSGTGIGDLGDIALLPIPKTCFQKPFQRPQLPFSHTAETVSPGYYAVKLASPNVFVELTATKRVGMH